MFKTKLIGAIVVTSVSLGGLFIDSASAQITSNGSDISGGVGSDVTGGIGSDITGGTGSDVTGGTGSDITGGTGSDITGGTGSDNTGPVTDTGGDPDTGDDNQDSDDDNQDPGTDNQDPGTDNQDPGTDNQDPGTDNQDPVTDNQDPVTDNQITPQNNQNLPDARDITGANIFTFTQFGGLNPLIIDGGRKLAEKITEAYINCTPCDCGSTKICVTRRFSINPPATNRTTTTSQTRRFVLGTPNPNRTCNKPGKPECEELHVLLMEADLFIENVDRQLEAYKDRLANRLW